MAKLEQKITASVIGYTLNVVLMYEVDDQPKNIQEKRIKHLTEEQFYKLMDLLRENGGF